MMFTWRKFCDTLVDCSLMFSTIMFVIVSFRLLTFRFVSTFLAGCTNKEGNLDTTTIPHTKHTKPLWCHHRIGPLHMVRFLLHKRGGKKNWGLTYEKRILPSRRFEASGPRRILTPVRGQHNCGRGTTLCHRLHRRVFLYGKLGGKNCVTTQTLPRHSARRLRRIGDARYSRNCIQGNLYGSEALVE